MVYLEIVIIGVILIFIVTYRSSTGSGVYKFINEQTTKLYDKYAPYSYKEMRKKIKSLGLDYTPRQYFVQVVLFAGIAGAIGYLYFYNLIVSIVYAVIAIIFIPYITYLRSKRQYSEFIFEQVQVYVTNTIMEFATTQAFIKSLEGVVESGILEDPVLSDVKTMIALSYEKGEVTDSIAYMNAKYPYFMVKNMLQLFLQVTKNIVTIHFYIKILILQPIYNIKHYKKRMKSKIDSILNLVILSYFKMLNKIIHQTQIQFDYHKFEEHSTSPTFFY